MSNFFNIYPYIIN